MKPARASYPAATSGKVRVIRDARDASLDFYVSRAVAVATYDSCKLSWDLTNEAFCYNEHTPATFYGTYYEKPPCIHCNDSGIIIYRPFGKPSHTGRCSCQGRKS